MSRETIINRMTCPKATCSRSLTTLTGPGPQILYLRPNDATPCAQDSGSTPLCAQLGSMGKPATLDEGHTLAQTLISQGQSTSVLLKGVAPGTYGTGADYTLGSGVPGIAGLNYQFSDSNLCTVVGNITRPPQPVAPTSSVKPKAAGGVGSSSPSISGATVQGKVFLAGSATLNDVSVIAQASSVNSALSVAKVSGADTMTVNLNNVSADASNTLASAWEIIHSSSDPSSVLNINTNNATLSGKNKGSNVLSKFTQTSPGTTNHKISGSKVSFPDDLSLNPRAAPSGGAAISTTASNGSYNFKGENLDTTTDSADIHQMNVSGTANIQSKTTNCTGTTKTGSAFNGNFSDNAVSVHSSNGSSLQQSQSTGKPLESKTVSGNAVSTTEKTGASHSSNTANGPAHVVSASGNSSSTEKITDSKSSNTGVNSILTQVAAQDSATHSHTTINSQMSANSPDPTQPAQISVYNLQDSAQMTDNKTNSDFTATNHGNAMETNTQGTSSFSTTCNGNKFISKGTPSGPFFINNASDSSTFGITSSGDTSNLTTPSATSSPAVISTNTSGNAKFSQSNSNENTTINVGSGGAGAKVRGEKFLPVGGAYQINTADSSSVDSTTLGGKKSMVPAAGSIPSASLAFVSTAASGSSSISKTVQNQVMDGTTLVSGADGFASSAADGASNNLTIAGNKFTTGAGNWLNSQTSQGASLTVNSSGNIAIGSGSSLIQFNNAGTANYNSNGDKHTLVVSPTSNTLGFAATLPTTIKSVSTTGTGATTGITTASIESNPAGTIHQESTGSGAMTTWAYSGSTWSSGLGIDKLTDISGFSSLNFNSSQFTGSQLYNNFNNGITSDTFANVAATAIPSMVGTVQAKTDLKIPMMTMTNGATGSTGAINPAATSTLKMSGCQLTAHPTSTAAVVSVQNLTGTPAQANLLVSNSDLSHTGSDSSQHGVDLQNATTSVRTSNVNTNEGSPVNAVGSNVGSSATSMVRTGSANGGGIINTANGSNVNAQASQLVAAAGTGLQSDGTTIHNMSATSIATPGLICNGGTLAQAGNGSLPLNSTVSATTTLVPVANTPTVAP